MTPFPFLSNLWNLPPASEPNSASVSRKKNSRQCSSTPYNESIHGYCRRIVERSSGQTTFLVIPAIFVLGAAAVLAAVYLDISSRGTRKETRQLRAEITRLRIAVWANRASFSAARSSPAGCSRHSRSPHLPLANL